MRNVYHKFAVFCERIFSVINMQSCIYMENVCHDKLVTFMWEMLIARILLVFLWRILIIIILLDFCVVNVMVRISSHLYGKCMMLHGWVCVGNVYLKIRQHLSVFYKMVTFQWGMLTMISWSNLSQKWLQISNIYMGSVNHDTLVRFLLGMSMISLKFLWKMLTMVSWWHFC